MSRAQRNFIHNYFFFMNFCERKIYHKLYRQRTHDNDGGQQHEGMYRILFIIILHFVRNSFHGQLWKKCNFSLSLISF